jgi:hypothetical protein
VTAEELGGAPPAELGARHQPHPRPAGVHRAGVLPCHRGHDVAELLADFGASQGPSRQVQLTGDLESGENIGVPAGDLPERPRTAKDEGTRPP